MPAQPAPIRDRVIPKEVALAQAADSILESVRAHQRAQLEVGRRDATKVAAR